MNRTYRFFLLTAALVLLLACNFPLSGQENTEEEGVLPTLPLISQPTVEKAPTATLPPLPTASPQEVNTGTHNLHVVPTSLTCELSTEEGDETRTITFTADQVEITNSNKEGSAFYQKIGENRYMRINDAGRPIVVVLNTTGYVLEIYDVDADPDQTDACAYYTFTIQD
jgi:hypothetical protein